MLIAVGCATLTIFYHDFDAISVLKMKNFNFLSTRLLKETQKLFGTNLKIFGTLRVCRHYNATSGGKSVNEREFLEVPEKITQRE
jgi:hypothetical protein